MLGTLVNTGAIAAGSAAGLLLRRGIPERFTDTVIKTLGLATLLLGLGGVFARMLFVQKDGTLSTQNVMLLIFSLVLGAVAGELLKLDDRMNSLGKRLGSLLRSKDGRFSEGFVTAALIYCVGAMAILGSLQDGLSNDPTILFQKSILDGVMSILLASTLGVGVLFSAVPVLVYQGLITLLAVFLRPFLGDEVIALLSLVGSALIVCIGLNLLGATKIKTANLLPAIILPVIYGIVKSFCAG